MLCHQLQVQFMIESRAIHQLLALGFGRKSEDWKMYGRSSSVSTGILLISSIVVKSRGNICIFETVLVE